MPCLLDVENVGILFGRRGQEMRKMASMFADGYIKGRRDVVLVLNSGMLIAWVLIGRLNVL